MKVQFLSVNSWCPEAENEDTVSLLINDSILVDTGWHSVRNLLRAGRTPRDVRQLLFTHMHQDHYISLPSFLFYLLNGYQDAGSVEIYGPGRVGEITQQSLVLAGRDIYYQTCPVPAVHTLTPGDSFRAGGLLVETCASHHAVIGVSYRFTDEKTGGTCVYTGDTTPSEELAAFAKGCDVLIHEQSFGIDAPRDRSNSYCHSTVREAAECAAAAGVKKLFMVHCPTGNREESVAFARTIFPESYRPLALDSFEI